MATPTYSLIDSTTLSSSAFSVTFSGISGDYRDLVLVVEFNTTNTSGFGFAGIEVNGDSTAANYSQVVAYGNGTGGVSDAATGVGYFYVNGYAGTSTTKKCLSVNHFLDYSATDKDKTLLQRTSTGEYVEMQAGRYGSTSAITSLSIDSLGDSASFTSGSTFYLYGVA